jgi:hypothetical protein
MTFLHAVGSTLTGEIVPLHGTRETTALTFTDDIDGCDALKSIDLHLAANSQIASPATNLANKPLGLTTSLGHSLDSSRRTLLGSLAVELGYLTTLSAGRQTPGLIEKTKLNGFVAISLGSADLKDIAGTSLHNGHGHGNARFIENLRHTDLTAQYADNSTAGNIFIRSHCSNP